MSWWLSVVGCCCVLLLLLLLLPAAAHSCCCSVGIATAGTSPSGTFCVVSCPSCAKSARAWVVRWLSPSTTCEHSRTEIYCTMQKHMMCGNRWKHGSGVKNRWHFDRPSDEVASWFDTSIKLKGES